MTELAIRPDRPDRPVATADNGYAPALAENSALVLWAYEARQAALVAESLAKTSFIPKTMQGRPADVTAAILAGQELGLKPMASLRSMDVVQGTPALRAHAMRGLVQSRGHEVQVVESTETRCIMRGRRKGEQEWQTSRWTIERATKLGVVGRNPEWKKQPQTMLLNRATGEICRIVASDVIYAMPYVAEELDDDSFATGPGTEPTPAIAPARRTARRAPLPATERAPDPEPDLDEPAEEVEPITAPQQKKLHALLREHNLSDRGAGLDKISEILDREVTSTKDLSKQDAMRVIDALETPAVVEDPPFDDEWPPVAVPPEPTP